MKPCPASATCQTSVVDMAMALLDGEPGMAPNTPAVGKRSDGNAMLERAVIKIPPVGPEKPTRPRGTSERGNARMKPNARHYSRPCPESVEVKRLSANVFPNTTSKTTACPRSGRRRYGSRKSGTSWIAVNATVWRVM